MWFFHSKTECIDCQRIIPQRLAEQNDGRCDACAESREKSIVQRLRFQQAIESGAAFRHTSKELDSSIVPTEFQIDDSCWFLQPEFYGEYKGGTIKTIDDALTDVEAGDNGNLFLVSDSNGQLNLGFTGKFGVCEYINEDRGQWLYAFTGDNLTEQVDKENQVDQKCPCCGIGMLWYPSRFHIPRAAALKLAREIPVGGIPPDVKWLDSGDFSLTEPGRG